MSYAIGIVTYQPDKQRLQENRVQLLQKQNLFLLKMTWVM